MGHPRASLSRRGRAILWCDQHPILAHAITVVAGLIYLWAMLGISVSIA